jgi:hypothetical protein
MLIRVMPIAAAAIAAIAIGSASPANAQPLQPGPHSAIADIALPEGTVPCTSSGCRTPPEHEEVWRYNAPYDDVVVFLRNQLGTGPYDRLPPCPLGAANDGPEWKWSDDARWLAVAVSRAGDNAPFGKIYIACGPVHPADQGRCHPAYSHGET